MFVTVALLSLGLQLLSAVVQAFQVRRPWPPVRLQVAQHLTKSGTSHLPLVHEEFAQLVSRGWLHYNLTLNNGTLDFKQHPPSLDRLTNYAIASDDDKVEVWVLPKGAKMQSWLHNEESKQDESLFQNVLIRRCDNVSLTREDECLQLLLEGTTAICIGLPGIGKSISTTPMLVKALDTIVQRHRTLPGEVPPDGFEEVFYRVGKKLYKFAWDMEKKELGCEAITEASNVLEVMEMFQLRRTFFDESYKRCLIVDMKEKEVDPEEKGYYTASARNAFDHTFKMFAKAGAPFFVIEPPSELALHVMYLAAREFSSPLPSHINTVGKFEKVKAKIGPVPRYLFSRKSAAYKSYLNERSTASKNPWKDVNMNKVSVSNVGSTFKFFVAPFIRKGATTSMIGGDEQGNEGVLEDEDEQGDEGVLEDEDEQGDEGVLEDEEDRVYEFRCLSDHCKIVLATHVTLPKHLAFFREYGTDPAELLEAVAVYAGFMTNKHALTSSLPEQCRKENWLVYQDPGMGKLMGHHLLPNTTVTYILPRCHRIHKFGGSEFARPVWELKEGVLYDPEGTKHPVVESWCVNHTTKQLVGLQVTTSVFSKHVFDIANVDHVFDKFSLDDDRGRPYSVVIVGVNDVSLGDPDGLRFNEGSGASHSLAWWQNETQQNSSFAWPHSMRVQTYLMRIPVFDMTPFELSNIIPNATMRAERETKESAQNERIKRLEAIVEEITAEREKFRAIVVEQALEKYDRGGGGGGGGGGGNEAKDETESENDANAVNTEAQRKASKRERGGEAKTKAKKK